MFSLVSSKFLAMRNIVVYSVYNNQRYFCKFLSSNQIMQPMCLCVQWEGIGPLPKSPKLTHICNPANTNCHAALWQFGFSSCKEGIQEEIDFWPEINLVIRNKMMIFKTHTAKAFFLSVMSLPRTSKDLNSCPSFLLSLCIETKSWQKHQFLVNFY